MQFFRNSYPTNLFFYLLLAIATLYVFSFFYPWLFFISRITVFLFVGACLWEGIVLYATKKTIRVVREYPEKLSNGDENELKIHIENEYPIKVRLRVIEEVPPMLQVRGIHFDFRLKASHSKIISFFIRPTQRGIYSFGNCLVFVSHLGLWERRFKTLTPCDIPCYPSYIQLKKYQLMATTNRLNEIGVKKIRRIGNTMEFDTIREYIKGDEYRFINWKATAKSKKLMVNQYEDERSQPVYSVLDLSRTMRMPFHELTLLDYAINTSLVLSNITLLKNDKAGLLTFSNDGMKHIKADRRNHQQRLITEALYAIKTDFKEADFGQLYSFIRRNINHRSLLFLYSNFETMDALNRQLPFLRLLNRSHIIVAIVFKNTELETLSKQKAQKSFEIYNQIMAEKFLYEKQLIIQELRMNGIQTLYTSPENLTVNSINKYLEIKARGMI